MRRLLIVAVAGLAFSALFLLAFPSATLAYEAVVVLHLFLGAAFVILFLPAARRLLSGRGLAERTGWILAGLGAVLGAILIYTGTRRDHARLLHWHELVSALAIPLLLLAWSGSRGWIAGSLPKTILRAAACVAVMALIGWGAWWIRTVPWQRNHQIHNPAMSPESMNAEGDGPGGPFFPSAAQTKTGKVVPEDYFMDSSACERCHSDIYKQWLSSAHHFSSFNNQWYRKSIEYMQEVNGVHASKWCAGCHDAALFFPGNFNTPIKDRIFTPPAQAGMGCMVCHSIRTVKSTTGNGDFVLEYPAMHKLVASKNPLVRKMVDFLIEENPEPHRRTFLKPFMKVTPSEYCSACHKVHLDLPVNNYRWIRGFNDYDNWQASGVSGMGARSFYYPPKPMTCADCHMTQVASQDAGNIDGLVHSHRFIGANTAVPFVNGDDVQLKATEQFLAGGKLRVDIFAISPETAQTKNNPNLSIRSDVPQIQTTFAVGEEAETSTPTGEIPSVETGPVTAPLNRVQPAVRSGDAVRVDVVVRTLAVGHFFPGGTVDAFDCWLELKATDDQDKTIFWSGMVEDNGHGPVEPGAHFYRSLAIDDHGNEINKRNAWATRAVVYAHLIPPGAADTAHFRLQIPKDQRGPIHLEANLKYRKFAWFNTQFSFAGVSQSAAASDVSKDYDDRKVVFTGDLKQVSGPLKAIPDLPIVTIASSRVDLNVLPAGASPPAPKVDLQKDDWQRWNDYGIGLFLQGDLIGAEQAFTRITEIAPENPDGWVNIGRVRVQEGNMGGARTVLEKALKLSPELARAHYFYARVLRQVGDYDGSIQHLNVVLAQYPQDRVVRNDLGRVLFLQHKYGDATTEFEKTLAIDPEDLEANYNLMLCYTGMGNPTQASEYQKRYMRFKADESSQALTGPYRAKHPDDNLERQPIHEHHSVALETLSHRRQTPQKLAVVQGTKTLDPALARRGGN